VWSCILGVKGACTVFYVVGLNNVLVRPQPVSACASSSLVASRHHRADLDSPRQGATCTAQKSIQKTRVAAPTPSLLLAPCFQTHGVD
jgi:hypothetical protein